MAAGFGRELLSSPEMRPLAVHHDHQARNKEGQHWWR
jgi:hypothetical protein